MIYLAIFLGGGIGSLMRYGTSKLGNQMTSTDLPAGTILSNVLACLILALLLTTFKQQIKENEFLFYFGVVGLCGGYSTFSTFSLETINLVQAGHTGLAVLNIGISLAVCLGLIYAFVKN